MTNPSNSSETIPPEMRLEAKSLAEELLLLLGLSKGGTNKSMQATGLCRSLLYRIANEGAGRCEFGTFVKLQDGEARLKEYIKEQVSLGSAS